MESYRIQSKMEMSSAGVILSAKLSDEKHKKESGVVSKQDVSISCATVRGLESAGMKMGEYKRYIYDKISELPVHPTQLNRSASVFISEDGFAAMKNDPEYEEWVIGKLREDFAICNPISQMHGSYVIYQFGAKKSEYRGDSWYAEFQNGNGKQIYKERSKGNFWSTHASEQKEILEAHNEYVRDKKRRELELMQQDASKSNPVLNPGYTSMSCAAESYDANLTFINSLDGGIPETVTTKRFMADGTIITTTKKDGKIVEQSKKKPHLIPVTDGLTGKVKMEPFQSIFDLMG